MTFGEIPQVAEFTPNALYALASGNVPEPICDMSTIKTTCRQCGRTFEPTPEAIRAGLWRTCPACRRIVKAAQSRLHTLGNYGQSREPATRPTRPP